MSTHAQVSQSSSCNAHDNPAPQSASSPFDYPKYDTIVIRSSDHVYFHLRKGVLAEASAVFEEMFGAPIPSGHAVDNGSVLLTQSSRTLDMRSGPQS